MEEIVLLFIQASARSLLPGHLNHFVRVAAGQVAAGRNRWP